MALGHAARRTRQSHLPLPDRPGEARRGEFAGFICQSSAPRFPSRSLPQRGTLLRAGRKPPHPI